MIAAIRFLVVTSAGQVEAGVYSGTGTGRSAAPASLLARTGVVDCPQAGIAELALTALVSVNAGNWFAFTCNAAIDMAQSGIGAGLQPGFLAGLADYEDVAFPLPTTAAPSGVNTPGLLALSGVPA